MRRFIVEAAKMENKKKLSSTYYNSALLSQETENERSFLVSYFLELNVAANNNT